MEWFEANIPYQNMRALKLHFPKHSEVDMKIGDLVEFDDFLYTNREDTIVGVVVGKWKKIPEPIARPHEVEVYWKIQIGDKTIHLEEHLIRKIS